MLRWCNILHLSTIVLHDASVFAACTASWALHCATNSLGLCLTPVVPCRLVVVMQALCALQHAPAGDRLLRTVLSPQPPGGPAAQHVAAPGPAPDSSSQQLAALPAGLRQALQAEYNSSQCAAVAACMDQRFPFVLVQGPPGTGKTSAIIGMLSALLSTGEKPQPAAGRAQGPAPRPKAASAAAGTLKPPSVAAKRAASGALAVPKDAAAAAAGDADSSLPARAAQSALRLGAKPPVRVLVCAQSNAAIDELIIRLADKGVWCGSGARRALGMVRVGRSDAMHPSILMFHVDALADTHVQQEAQKRAQAAAPGGQHQDQQQLQQGGKAGRAASAATNNSAAAADKGPGAQSPLDRKIQELTEQLQEVEKKLAALAKQGTAEAEATEAHPEAVEQTQLAGQRPQQPQQGLVGQKRSSDATAQSAGGDQGSMPPPASKLPRVAGAADVAARRADGQEAQPASSGSDMQLSDDGMVPQHDSTAPSHAQQLPAVTSRQQQQASVGHRAAAADSSRLDYPQHRSRGASTAENPRSKARSRSRGRGPAGQHSSSRSPSEQGSEGSRHKRSGRSRSPGRHGNTRDSPQRPHSSSKGGSSRSRRHRSRSRSGSRGSGARKRSRRSSSRGRSSRSPDGRHSHRRSSEGERGAETERGRDRDRGRHESNRSSRDGSRRGRSRSRDRGRASDRGGFSPDERGTAAGDRAGRSRDSDRTARSSKDPDRRRSSSQGRDKDRAGGNGSSGKAGRDYDAGRPQDRPADKSSRGSDGVHQRIGGSSSSSKRRSNSSDRARADGKDGPAMIAGQSSDADGCGRADSTHGTGQQHVAAGGAGHQGSHQQAPQPAAQEAQQHHAPRCQQEHGAEQQQPLPPSRQEEGELIQRQQQHPAAVASLLRDKQRSLLAALRELERQRAEGGATGGMDRRELDRAKKGARQEVIKAAEVVVSLTGTPMGGVLSSLVHCRGK